MVKSFFSKNRYQLGEILLFLYNKTRIIEPNSRSYQLIISGTMTHTSYPEDLRPNPLDRIICMKIGNIQRENLYEMSRKYWKVNFRRAKEATHVLAIVDGYVKAVYVPYKWYPTQNSHYLGRYEFDGVEDTGSEYISKSVKALYGKSQNPIKYVNL